MLPTHRLKTIQIFIKFHKLVLELPVQLNKITKKALKMRIQKFLRISNYASPG